MHQLKDRNGDQVRVKCDPDAVYSLKKDRPEFTVWASRVTCVDCLQLDDVAEAQPVADG